MSSSMRPEKPLAAQCVTVSVAVPACTSQADRGCDHRLSSAKLEFASECELYVALDVAAQGPDLAMVGRIGCLDVASLKLTLIDLQHILEAFAQ
eukprot:2025847-Rhodomonas_salina.1